MSEISRGKKCRVLLIDDELDMIYIVKAGLERKGFEVDSYIDPIPIIIYSLTNFD